MSSKNDVTLPSQKDCNDVELDDEEEKQEIDEEDMSSSTETSDREDHKRDVAKEASEALDNDEKAATIDASKSDSTKPSEEESQETKNTEAAENDEEAETAIDVIGVLAAAADEDFSGQSSGGKDQVTEEEEGKEVVQVKEEVSEEAALNVNAPAAAAAAKEKNGSDHPFAQEDLKKGAYIKDKKVEETKSYGKTTIGVASSQYREKYDDGKRKEDFGKMNFALPKSKDSAYPMDLDADIEVGHDCSSRSLELAAAAAAANDDTAAIHDGSFRDNSRRKKGGVVRIGSSSGRRERATEPGAEYVPQRAPGLSMRWYVDRRMRSEAIRRERQDTVLVVQEQPVITVGSSAASPSSTTPLSPFTTVAYSQWSQSKLQGHRRRFYYYIWAAVVAALVVSLVGIAVGVTVWYKNKNDDSGITKFDAYTNDCSVLSGQSHPHVLTQCHCNGQITIIPTDIKERYNLLSKSFITTIFPDFQEPIDSCHARNQALVWLASGEGGGGGGGGDALNLPTMRQRYSLALFFILLNGPTWTESKAWLSSDHECDWFGLGCDSQKQQQQVVSVALSINKLSGELPQDMALLTSLESFDFAGNQLQGQIPNEIFGNLTLLTSITLNGNQFNGTLPVSLSNLSALQELQLSDNQLQGPIPTEYGRLTQLRTIDLKQNLLTGQLPSEIGLWSNVIEFISLTTNQLQNSTIPTQFGLLTQLRNLGLDSTGIKGTIPTELFNIGTSLNILNLGSNQLVGTIPTQVGQVTNITDLWLLSNQLTGTLPTELGLTVNLAKFDVSSNQMTGTIPTELAMVHQVFAYFSWDGNLFNGTVPASVCNVSHPIGCIATLTCGCCTCASSVKNGD